MRRLKQTFVVAAIALVIILLTLGIERFPWVLLLPVAAIAVAYPAYLLRRIFALRRKGYFVTNSRKQPVIYQERRNGRVLSVPICTEHIEPGRNDVIVPTRADWLRTAPEWAKDRRDEIFKRIIEARPKGWAIFPYDWAA
jgi:hypothetical protein